MRRRTKIAVLVSAGALMSATLAGVARADPTVTSVTPGQAINNAAVTLQINGLLFDDGPGLSARLERTSNPSIVGTNVSFVNATRITARFDIINVSPGTWTVRVTNPDGTFGLCVCFTITAPAPTASGMTPKNIGQGADGGAVTVSGTNFFLNAMLSANDSGITFDSVVVVNTTTITARIFVTLATSTGNKNLIVTNADGQAATCSACIVITLAPAYSDGVSPNPAPVSPSNRGAGANNVNLTLNGPPAGSNFQAGATVTFSNPKITVNSVTFNAGPPVTLTVNISIALDAIPGSTDVTVQNPDYGKRTCVVGGNPCFRVAALLTTTSSDPSNLGQGAPSPAPSMTMQQGTLVRIRGTNFVSGASVTFSGAGITFASMGGTSFVDSTEIDVNISVASDATPGPRDITVNNNNGGATASCVACIRIDITASVTGALPNSVDQGQVVDVTVSGAAFLSTATVSFSGSGVTPERTDFINSTTLIARSVSVGAAATPGARNVTVNNNNRGNNGSCSGCETVNGGGVTVPGPPPTTIPTTVTSVSPSAVPNTASVTLTIRGTGFDRTPMAAIARLQRPGLPDVVGTTNSVSTDMTTISATFDVTNKTPGRWDVRVTNTSPPAPNPATNVCRLCFILAGGAPELLASGVNPGAVGQGQASVDIVLTGKNFYPGAAVTFSNPGVSIVSTTVQNSTTIVVRINIGSGAPVGRFEITVTNDDGLSVTCSCFDVGPPQGRYTALPPVRVLDTRDGTGGWFGKVGPDSEIVVTLTNVGGVPATGVSAVVVNTTVTEGTSTSYLTVYPDGAERPTASNLNFSAGQTVPNLVVVPLGPNGRGRIYNAFGFVNVVMDTQGYYGVQAAGPDGRLQAISPLRVRDTRNDNAKLGPDSFITVKVTGQGGAAGTPAMGVSAVVLNVTVTEGTADSYITAYPFGTTRPLASNLNFVPGETVPNRVMVKVPPDGLVNFYNAFGFAHLVIDINAYLTDGTVTTGAAGALQALSPRRILDTRDSTGGLPGKVGPDATINLQVAGRAGVPLNGATAVVLNVTVTEPTADGYLTLFPSGTTAPLASDLNFVAGETVPNLVVVKLGSTGQVGVKNAFGHSHVVGDLIGWYS